MAESSRKALGGVLPASEDWSTEFNRAHLLACFLIIASAVALLYVTVPTDSLGWWTLGFLVWVLIGHAILILRGIRLNPLVDPATFDVRGALRAHLRAIVWFI